MRDEPQKSHLPSFARKKTLFTRAKWKEPLEKNNTSLNHPRTTSFHRATRWPIISNDAIKENRKENQPTTSLIARRPRIILRVPAHEFTWACMRTHVYVHWCPSGERTRAAVTRRSKSRRRRRRRRRQLRIETRHVMRREPLARRAHTSWK